MALMKEGLWTIVTEEETEPTTGAAEIAKFRSRRDKALATIVLSVDTTLLYLTSNPEDPAAVWKKLANQFEKKTWATRLDLRRLHSMRLKDGDSAQEHIKTMTELFDALAVAGETVSDEDRVVYLLASLPDMYNVLVTALEANAEVPKLEVVIERILHQERKTKEEADSTSETAMTSRRVPRRPKPKCYNCGKMGHIQRYCRAKKEGQDKDEGQKERKDSQRQRVTVSVDDNSDTDSDDFGLVNATDCVLSVSSECEWIVDSGATSHMCSNKKAFTTLYQLKEPIKVTVGDGRALTAVGRGDVVLDVELPNSESKSCTMHDVLYVPELSYNLMSVAKVSQKGKIVKFTSNACYILGQCLLTLICHIHVGLKLYQQQLTCVTGAQPEQLLR